MIDTINNLMFADNWRPDYIVGMTRGGLVPAVMMSNKTSIMMHALDVRFRDTDNNYDGQIGRAHVRTPVTSLSRMPSSA